MRPEIAEPGKKASRPGHSPRAMFAKLIIPLSLSSLPWPANRGAAWPKHGRGDGVYQGIRSFLGDVLTASRFA
jgi:hypothetical protein